MEHVDSLIHAQWVIPVEPDNTVLSQHSLAIKDGRIVAVLPRAQAEQRFQCADIVELPYHALIPGLVNAHCHSAMTLFRGLADDLPLMEWLTQHIWPAEGRWINHEFVRDGSELAIAEMLRGGTTCVNDMYFFPDETARAMDAAGMRACIGMILIDFPTVWAQNADEYIHKGLELHDYYRNNPRIRTAFAPHAPYTVSNQPLERVRVLADELDVPIHIHVQETEDEIAQSLTQHNERPLSRLHKLGLVSPRLLAVHMTQLTPSEIDLAAAQGIHVMHCPESNMKLASGFCPVQKLLDAGVNVALGTDGAASNNDLDMFGEMRSAAMVGKAYAKNAAALPAHTVLRMATMNGAKALGLDDEIGSLQAGKAADMVAIHLGSLENTPMYHPISHIVYVASRHDVTNVWVGGKRLVHNRRLTTLDETHLRSKAQQWQMKISTADAPNNK